VNNVELALEVYKKVVYQNVPFSLALKNEWKNQKVDFAQRGEVSALVGCALRHYLIFELRIKEIKEDISNDGFAICSLGLANIFFLKKEDKASFSKKCSKLLNDEEFEILKTLLDKFENSEHLIPDTINANSVEFLAYRYNTPLWLVKMWNKHYGLNVLYKILKSNNRPSDVYAKTLFNEEILNEDFESVEGHKNLYKYIGKEQLKRNHLYGAKNMFAYSLGMDEMLNKIDIDPVRGIALYSAYSNNLLLDLVSRTSKYLKMDIISPTFQALSETQKAVASYGFENMKVYEASASSIITCISSKVHTFFVLPSNSRFSLLRNTPDYFLKIDQTNMDAFINGEKEALNEVADLIDDGGNIVYCIDTVSQKEGHLLIESFLNEHSDFSLVEEKQFLGFGSSSSMYYAILTKGLNND